LEGRHVDVWSFVGVPEHPSTEYATSRKGNNFFVGNSRFFLKKKFFFFFFEKNSLIEQNQLTTSHKAFLKQLKIEN